MGLALVLALVRSEIIGKVKKPIVDVDEVLRVFGKTRRSARRATFARSGASSRRSGSGNRRGPKGEEDDPEEVIRKRRSREELGPDWRPRFEVEEFVDRAADRLEVNLEDLRSRRKAEGVARARELLMIVGVERYGLKVKDLAKQLNKSPGGMTQAIVRASRKRNEDSGFRKALARLDRGLADCLGRDTEQ